MKGVEYRGVTSIDGPIIIVRRTEKIFYGETVYVRDRNGEKRTGRVIDLSETAAVVQIFGTTTGLDLGETTDVFLTDLVSQLTVIRRLFQTKKSM